MLEVITNCDHSSQCDFFSLGAIVSELMTGQRPYVGRSRQEIREQMITKQAMIEIPLAGWSYKPLISQIDCWNEDLNADWEASLGVRDCVNIRGFVISTGRHFRAYCT